MHVGPSAQRRSSDRPPTESDTSEHSYHLRAASGDAGYLQARDSSPFGTDAVQEIPISRSTSSAVRTVPIAGGSIELPRMTSTRHVSGDVRISVEVPRQLAEQGDGPLPTLSGRIVRRRRRIPLWLTLAFGVMTFCGLVLAVCIAPLTIYNYRRIKSQRATRTVDQLQATIVPMLQAIAKATVNRTSDSP